MKDLLVRLYTGIKLRQWPHGRRLSPLATLRGNVSIGKYTYVSSYADIRGIGSATRIGNYCSLARGVKVLSAGQVHDVDALSTFPFYLIDRTLKRADFMARKGDVVIGNDVWIGVDAIVMPGVKIGDGAVIGAGAVVTRDVAAFQIVAGVPARPVRMRFSERICAAIADSKWWERDYRELQPLIHVLNSPRHGGGEDIRQMLTWLASADLIA